MEFFAVFSPEITLGNAITALAGVISWAVTWGTFTATQAAIKKTVEEHAQRLNEIDRTGGLATVSDRASLNERVRDHEQRIRRLETSLTTIEAIALNVQVIRSRIERIPMHELEAK